MLLRFPKSRAYLPFSALLDFPALRWPKPLIA